MTPDLPLIARRIRRAVIEATTAAGSGHPTSCLSAADLMVTLFFDGHYHYDFTRPDFANNDRFIMSKGHAAPLLYALYEACGALSYDELLTLRKFSSPLEGHPTMHFPFAEAPTGSLGQGLSIGVGFALNAKYLDQADYHTFVLLGDGELAEGSNWEALQLAAHYKLSSLVAIVDVNEYGMCGKTMHDDASWYEQTFKAFGWQTFIINGHDFKEITKAFTLAREEDKPSVIIARTIKGQGVSFLAGKPGWHGKTLSHDLCAQALSELGDVSRDEVYALAQPKSFTRPKPVASSPKRLHYSPNDEFPTRRGYGNALLHIAPAYPDIIVLDAETSVSTYTDDFAKAFSKRFFEMFIAEQNMVGTAIGLARSGKHPFISTFAAFLMRACDHLRMAHYAGVRMTVVGSHAGVSIGQDGPSQMGLEDLAFFRTLKGTIILYPGDAVACERLVELAASCNGMKYLRLTRAATPIVYDEHEEFVVGGSHTLLESPHDELTIVAAGITLHEALKAAHLLGEEGQNVRVIDLYSIQPLDRQTLRAAAKQTRRILTVEDHSVHGGLGEAVAHELADMPCVVRILGVEKIPRSATPKEMLAFMGIDAKGIYEAAKALLGSTDV